MTLYVTYWSPVKISPPGGSPFLTDAREVLAAADRAIDRARGGAGELPLRLGYVSWLPSEAAAIPEIRVRIDEWVLPSHTQAARVAEGASTWRSLGSRRRTSHDTTWPRISCGTSHLKPIPRLVVVHELGGPVVQVPELGVPVGVLLALLLLCRSLQAVAGGPQDTAHCVV